MASTTGRGPGSTRVGQMDSLPLTRLEKNIRDAKVTYHSPGLEKRKYLYMVSPSIPTRRAVQSHMKKGFGIDTWNAT